MDIDPHYKPKPANQAFAKSLRKNMSDEEALLWSFLRDFRKRGYAIKRQAALGPYVADFLCRKAKVIIEVDGSQHNEPSALSYDKKRDQWMVERHYIVLRYSTTEIRKDIGSVVDGIEHHIRQKLNLD